MSYERCLHLSICARHPCAGAMLIFSVPFQCEWMITEGNPMILITFCFQRASLPFTSRMSRVPVRRAQGQSARENICNYMYVIIVIIIMIIIVIIIIISTERAGE